MSNVVHDFVRPVADALSVPLILALGLLVIVTITHLVSWLWYLIQQRGRRPLVVAVDPSRKRVGDSVDSAVLNDSLLAYLAADAHGSYVIAPGAGGPASPGVTTEALEPSHGWQAAALRFAVAREPSFLVSVGWYVARNEKPQKYRAVVRISRVPGDRIMASGSFDEKSEEGIIETVGCFCITFLRGRSRILRHTPRWERWSQGIEGYRAYRQGLEHQRCAELKLPAKERAYPDDTDYQKALDCFHQAARVEPANLLVQLHRAALLELIRKYKDAAEIYERCHSLWPEHIETAYRLGNAYKNLPQRVTGEKLQDHLERVKKQLRWWNLFKNLCRSLRPSRWNPGEYRYWRSWLELWPPGRVTRRATYAHAVTVATLLAKLLGQIDRPAKDVSERADAGPEAETFKTSSIKNLMEDLAGEILGSGSAPALVRLLHPERDPNEMASSHDHCWHGVEFEDVSRIPGVSGHHRRGVGWLALYNAACFFSVAIKLPQERPDLLPEFYTTEPDGTKGWNVAAKDWAEDCARAAIRELGALVRHPQHALEPAWLGSDNDLAPLRDSSTGKAWAGFVGLSAPPQNTAAGESEGARR